jgi:predicted MFS family arabinose efflux permease
MGVIQTAFAASSVLGIPMALVLSTHWGWNASFFLVVAVSALVGGLIWAYLRPVDEHLKDHPDRGPLHHLIKTVSNRLYLQGFATTGLLSVGGFMLMPFMSVFMVHNIGLPIGKLPLVYMITGAFSILTGPLIGRASDAYGILKVFGFGCAVTIVMVVIYTHLHSNPLWVLVMVIVMLQIGIFSRMISSSALMSALPTPADRGSYMSISSSLQQMSGGIAAVVAGLIVVQSPQGDLLHFDTLGYVLVGTTVVSLALMYLIDRKIGGTRPTSAPVPEVAAIME